MRRELRAQLVDGVGVRDDTGDRRAADGDGERSAAARRESCGRVDDRLLEAFVASARAELEGRAHEPVEEQVAGRGLGLRSREHEVAVDAEPVRGGRRHARVVALDTAAGDEDVGVLIARLRGEQLELAGLVARRARGR